MNELLEYLKTMKRSSQGFALIELLVIVVIVGIIVAIAVPAFLGNSGGGSGWE